MDPALITLAAFTMSMSAFAYIANHVVQAPTMSGDKWHMRHFAFTDNPVSAPYCWRPLLPALARHFGFKTVSFTATIATPFLIYWIVGGGWRGFLCSMLFVGNPGILSFQIRNPEYAEGLGQFLFISALWAMSVGSPLAWPLFLLCALCRETISATLGLIALFWNPWLIAPLVAGSAVAWFGRNEDKVNRHPLVEETVIGTVARWIRHKEYGAIHFAHVIQPLRGLAFTVPFMWDAVGPFARLGVVGFISIWLLALPASGQSRIICYWFGLLLPFAAALPIGWLWGFVLATWFWPLDYKVYDEGGGKKSFSFAR